MSIKDLAGVNGLFELAKLPAGVAAVVQPYGDIWQFLSSNREAAGADAVAKFLKEELIRASDALDGEVACVALTSSGLGPPLWLQENRASIAIAIVILFHSLESWASRRGRVALCAAHVGGGSRVRGMLASVTDKDEKVYLAIFIAGKLDVDEAAQLLGF